MKVTVRAGGTPTCRYDGRPNPRGFKLFLVVGEEIAEPSSETCSLLMLLLHLLPRLLRTSSHRLLSMLRKPLVLQEVLL